jgi:hypothetical protein
VCFGVNARAQTCARQRSAFTVAARRPRSDSALCGRDQTQRFAPGRGRQRHLDAPYYLVHGKTRMEYNKGRLKLMALPPMAARAPLLVAGLDGAAAVHRVPGGASTPSSARGEGTVGRQRP